jgi:hypothetical protein
MFSTIEVNTKTQSDGVNCGLHVVRAGMICAKLFVNVAKATGQGQRNRDNLASSIECLRGRCSMLETPCNYSEQQ